MDEARRNAMRYVELLRRAIPECSDIDEAVAVADVAFAESATFAVGNDGRWITIGGQRGSDGKRHGGCPVYVEDGKITKGAPSLQGRKISSLRDDPEKTVREAKLAAMRGSSREKSVLSRTVTKEENRREREYQIAVVAKKAKKLGIKPEHLHQFAGEIKAHHDAYADDVESLVRDAKEAANKQGINLHHKLGAFESGDYTHIQGFDKLARQMASQYSHILGNHGYESHGAYSSDDAQQKLFDIIKGGRPEKMPEAQAYEEAFEYLAEHHATKKADYEDDVPFSLDAMFAHDIENRRAQGILNRTVEVAKRISASARTDLEMAIRVGDRAEQYRAVVEFVAKYKARLADLLTSAQLAALLEGAREVAKAIPIVPMFPAAVPPATLEPAEAAALVEKLAAMPHAEREERIYDLPPDQQRFAREGLLARQQGGDGVPPSFFPSSVPGQSSEGVHYPVIDVAARELHSKNVMTRPEFDLLNDAARQKAFTVANVESVDTLAKIRDAIAESAEQGADVATFREKILEAVDEGTFMSDAHMETVYRTNIQTAFSDGQMAVLQHPFVRGGFPYAAYEAIHDDRVEATHLALETCGIDGTNIYRVDDPVFLLFRPPWRWCCRCSWRPMTVRQAARAGIAEAKRWLETGIEPTPPAFVQMPAFRPPPGFTRSISAQMSLLPMGV